MERREKGQTVRCQLCQDAFEVHRTDAKFCSPSCRQLAYRIRNGKSLVLRGRFGKRFPPECR